MSANYKMFYTLCSALVFVSQSVLFAGALSDSVHRNRPFGESIGLGVKFSQGQPQNHLALLKDLGVRWVRDNSSWARTESVPGQYAFPSVFRERLEFYRSNNIGVIFCLAYDNRAAYPPTPEDPHRNINPEAFGRYAAAVARLLRESHIRFVLELWNEPHNFVLRKQLGGPWHGTPPSPWLDHYVNLVHAAVTQVKAFDPGVTVLSDEDCTILHYRLLEAGLPRELDGFAFHPYLSRKMMTPEMTKEGWGGAWEAPFTLADGDHSFRSMVRRLRRQGEAKLGKAPELWITEFGCPVRKEVTENVTFALGSGTEKEIAAIVPRAFIGAEAAGVKVTAWFSFWDGPDGPLGLLANDGQKRKTYYAFQSMSRELAPFTLVSQPAGGGHLTTGVQAYLFRKGVDLKLVTWTIDGPARTLPLRGPLLDVQPIDVLGQKVQARRDSAGIRHLDLSGSPVYLSPIRNSEALENFFETMQ